MASLDRGGPGTTPRRVRGIQPSGGPQDAARVPAAHAARDQAIIYLEGEDLQRTFQLLRTAPDPFTFWVRQRTKDLFEGVDLTQIEPGSLSEYVFTAPSTQDDEASYRTWEGMERLGMISP
jgi:hypothetical protein